jgi:hypothetical protein
MKKALFLALAVLLFTLVGGRPCPAADAPYKAYYAARAEAKICDRTGDTACAVAKYLEAEAAAIAQEAAKTADDKVDWTTFAEWQRNNAAYCLIMKYQASPEKAMLKEALQILQAKVPANPAVLQKVNKNIEYCKTQLGI